MMTSAIRALL
uniref:Uncharacterized protein n=1 Tax=Lepeophtheirus salmonis TaxID=72036 RepID=A0A0K2V8R1_LEPSM